MGAVARSWGEMAAESLGGVLWRRRLRSPGIGTRWRQRALRAFCGGGGCVVRSWGEVATESLGNGREPWERSVGKGEGVVARSWGEVAAKSLGDVLCGRGLRSPGVGGEVAADGLGNVRWGRRLRSQGVAASWATAPRGQMGRRLTCSV